MPEISRFHGIRITMYYAPREHPPPHFHAEIGDDEALIEISDGSLCEGYLPRKSLALVQSWWKLHKRELYANWEVCMTHQGLLSIIEPLP